MNHLDEIKPPPVSRWFKLIKYQLHPEDIKIINYHPGTNQTQNTLIIGPSTTIFQVNGNYYSIDHAAGHLTPEQIINYLKDPILW